MRYRGRPGRRISLAHRSRILFLECLSQHALHVRLPDSRSTPRDVATGVYRSTAVSPALAGQSRRAGSASRVLPSSDAP
jgi:hypothetical protein